MRRFTAIDLFAGAGGFTVGAKAAGVDVLWASNHFEPCVRIHKRNHPEVIHSCQDLCQADFNDVPDHDVLLASPACQGHARARGLERAHHSSCRNTAWAVIACAEAKDPETIIVENVPEFTNWVNYPAWRLALESLDYVLTENVLNAYNVGVPQSRERVFVVAKKWYDGPREIPVGRSKLRPAKSFLNLKLDANKWSLIKTPNRAESTLERIAKGREDHGKKFLIAYYGQERGGRSLDRPIGTITTKGRHAIVNGKYMRMLTTKEEQAAMAFPASYIMPPQKALATKLLGNAVPPPLAAHVVKYAMRSN